MHIGEGVAVVIPPFTDDKCAVCGKKHATPKQAEYQPVAPNKGGWKRSSMRGKLEQNANKLAIYPKASFPPPYKYQGHHCLALSALVIHADKPSCKDKRPKLNFYLDKVGFYPNRDSNCIGLPEKSSKGDFKAFWEALDAKAPLQMHGPAHNENYFTKVNQLLARLLSVMTDTEVCQELTQFEWEQELKNAIAAAENYAFKQLGENSQYWRLHPEEQTQALAVYRGSPSQSFTISGAGGSTRMETGKGHMNAEINFPSIDLETGIF